MTTKTPENKNLMAAEGMLNTPESTWIKSMMDSVDSELFGDVNSSFAVKYAKPGFRTGFGAHMDSDEYEAFKAYLGDSNSAVSVSSKILEKTVHPFADSLEAFGIPFRDSNRKGLEVLLKNAIADAQTFTREATGNPDHRWNITSFSDADTGTTGIVSGTVPESAVRAWKTAWPYFLVPVWNKIESLFAFTTLPVEAETKHFTITGSQRYISFENGTKLRIPQDYRPVKTYTTNPLLNFSIRCYENWIWMADFDKAYTVDLSTPISAVTPANSQPAENLTRGFDKGFNLLANLATDVTYIAKPETDRVEPGITLLSALMLCTAADGTTVTLEEVFVNKQISSVRETPIVFSGYSRADRDAVTKRLNANAKLNLDTLHFKLNVRTGTLEPTKPITWTNQVVAIKVLANLSNRMNTQTSVMSWEPYVNELEFPDGIHINSAVPIEAVEDYKQVMTAEDYVRSTTATVTGVVSDMVSLQGLQHLANQYEVEKRRMLDVIPDSISGLDPFINLNPKFNIKPPETGPFSGIPTQWYELGFRVIEATAVQLVNLDLLNSAGGHFVMLANITDGAIFSNTEMLENVTPSGSSGGSLSIGYNLAFSTKAQIKALLVSSPNFISGEIFGIYRCDEVDHQRHLYLPSAYNVDTKNGYRNPKFQFVPNLFVRVLHMFHTIRSGGMFMMTVAGNDGTIGYAA